MLRVLSATRRALPRLTGPTTVRRYASVTDLSNFPAPGEQLHGFTLKRAKHVPELQLTALQLEHNKTGAEYLHVARDDSNNVFSISFKTNPPDATGVPHILEHTTLCGSHRYPARDPFFKMLPRSLSNFMNAMTYFEHTTYPFASANQQDFRNLRSVYLDSTLHPLLQEHDFTQEGWRLGPENPAAKAEDPSSKIVFKGVVYNEMKGQMSDAGYLYYVRLLEHLFPSLNSGGDPQKMTDLTYAQLKAFHAQHYHPSNSRIMTYGDMPLNEHLESLRKTLDQFDRTTPRNSVDFPAPFADSPRTVVLQGPVDPMAPFASQSKTSVTWLMAPASDVVENFSLGLMTSLLIDGYGSPMYRALIEAGLGSEWSPNTGYDSGQAQSVFGVGLAGVKKDNVDKVKQVIFDTLREVRKNGFDKAKVDGSLHQLELGLKHKTANFGMSMLQRLVPGWMNGVDAIELLEFQKTVDAFKAEFAKGDYLESLLQKYLLTDKHMIFTMHPSQSYGAEIVNEESRRLAGKIDEVVQRHGSLEEATQKLRDVENDLVARQNEESDVSCLPSVHVKDIPIEKNHVQTIDRTLSNVPTQWVEAPTNGLTYFRAISLFENLPSHLRTFVPLFCDALMRIGTKTRSMEQIEDLIKLKTGGVSFGYYASSSPSSVDVCHEGLSMTGYALDRNIPDMYQIITMLIRETDFDSTKAHRMIAELLQSSASGVLDSIASSGHAFARLHAGAGLTRHGLYSEQTGGVTQAANMTTLANHPELDTTVAAELIRVLKDIRDRVWGNLGNMRVAITCDSEQTMHNQASLETFLSTFTNEVQPTESASLNIPLRDWTSSLTRGTKTFFDLPYQVSYSGLLLNTVPYTDPSSAPLAVLAKILTNKHLHREIREKGGAYGGGAVNNALDGTFGFHSYRDPNPENTLRVVRDTGRWATERIWTHQDIEEAKLSVFQGVDAPRAVSQEGMARFLNGVTPEMMQTRREALLGVTAEQLTAVSERFLLNGVSGCNATILGPVKPFVEADGGWRVEKLGLGDAEDASVSPSE